MQATTKTSTGIEFSSATAIGIWEIALFSRDGVKFRDAAVRALRRLLTRKRQDAGLLALRAGVENWLIDASMRGLVDRIRVLASAGANLEVRTDGGWTALHCAAWRGHIDACKLLLGMGAHSDARDNRGRTALGVAKAFGCADSLACLC